MSKRDLWAVVAADIPTKSQYAEQEMTNGFAGRPEEDGWKLSLFFTVWRSKELVFHFSCDVRLAPGPIFL